MGLDAVVLCTCLAEGKARPFDRMELVHADEGWLDLREEADGDRLLHERFAAWLATACEHPRMQLANEGIANWTGYRLFQGALEQIGRAVFPTLVSTLPDSNSGTTSAIEARRGLLELDVFEQRVGGVDEIVLVDSATGEILHTHVAAYEGVFVLDGDARTELGFDATGLFLKQAGDAGGAELFRAMRVAITSTALEDLDRDVRFPYPSRWGVGQRVHVDIRPASAADYAYILEPLRRIFRASVRSGNPVVWC